MEITISTAEAQTKHPEAVQEIIAALRSSKSKSKGVPETEIKWHYMVSQACKAMTFGQMLSGIGKEKKEPETFDEYWNEMKPNLRCFFKGTVGKWFKFADKELEIPDAVKEQYRQSFEKDLAERKRVDSLTPEEKQAEIQGLLKQLGKSKGFFAIQVPVEE